MTIINATIGSNLSWTITGVLCSVVIGVLGWLIILGSPIKDQETSIKGQITGMKITSRRVVVKKEITLKAESHETFEKDSEKNEHE